MKKLILIVLYCLLSNLSDGVAGSLVHRRVCERQFWQCRGDDDCRICVGPADKMLGAVCLESLYAFSWWSLSLKCMPDERSEIRKCLEHYPSTVKAWKSTDEPPINETCRKDLCLWCYGIVDPKF